MRRPTALITGASSGIGYEFSKLFAKAGYQLILVARSEDKLTDLKERLEGTNVMIIAQDLAETDAGTKIYNKVKDNDQRIDVLVNNAGFGRGGYFDTTEVAVYEDMIHVNVLALTALTRLFAEDLQNSPFKNIPHGLLNVSSIAAYLPGPNQAVYHATKAYILNLSESIAKEWKGTGATVTALCPGPTDTGFFHTAKMEKSFMAKQAKPLQDAAEAGFLGFINGKRIVLPHTSDKMNAMMPRVMPNMWAATLVKKMNDPRLRKKS